MSLQTCLMYAAFTVLKASFQGHQEKARLLKYHKLCHKGSFWKQWKEKKGMSLTCHGIFLLRCRRSEKLEGEIRPFKTRQTCTWNWRAGKKGGKWIWWNWKGYISWSICQLLAKQQVWTPKPALVVTVPYFHNFQDNQDGVYCGPDSEMEARGKKNKNKKSKADLTNSLLSDHQ